ncbi:MAG: hypothetical protein KA369_16500 [Spirochaetes bacterium]|nr:hypothetical protein [Spirochaetota bacterium]
MKKKLLVFVMLLMITPIFSCDEEKANKNETNLTNLLFLLGNKTLTVNVTYTGTYVASTGTQYIYAYLYNV